MTLLYYQYRLLVLSQSARLGFSLYRCISLHEQQINNGLYTTFSFSFSARRLLITIIAINLNKTSHSTLVPVLITLKTLKIHLDLRG